MIYSKNGSYPAPIPFRIKLSDGRTRTDPTSFTEEEIADAGYIEVVDPPTITGIQVLEWSGTEWIVRNKTEEELQNEYNVRKYDLSNQINLYRDQLISSGFWFNNVKFDSRPEDQKRINGSALLAFMAISQGAQAGDYYWHNGVEPFSWIAKDNTIVQMDAQTVIEFGKKAAEHERSHVFAARTLKDMDPIPDDFNNSDYWPSED
jgi:hypothetical protein